MTASEYRVTLKDPADRDLCEEIERLREQLATERADVAYLRGALSKESELRQRAVAQVAQYRERVYQLEAELSFDDEPGEDNANDEFNGHARESLGDAGRCL